MEHLLNGVAIVAMCGNCPPASEQRTGPGVGAPGPNVAVPGGPFYRTWGFCDPFHPARCGRHLPPLAKVKFRII